MLATPTACVDHANHCLKMAAGAPPALAREFERLALKWSRLAQDLARAQAVEEDDNVISSDVAREG
jgi:hypothetical protein